MMNDRKALIILFGYVFWLLWTCSNMSPFYYSNEWADANVYFNVGKAVFNGKTLYTEVFDHKGPLIFFIYGFGYLISNNSFFGVFLIELFLWCAMAGAVYYLSRLFLGREYSCLAGLIFPVFLVELMKAGGSAEEFILAFQCVSLYFFVKYFKEKGASGHNPYYMLAHGVLCSMAFFIKLNLVLFWFLPLAGIFLNLLFRKKYGNLALNAFAFFVGGMVTAIPILTYLFFNDALGEAYRVYIDLNRRYAELQGAGETVLLLFYRLLYLFIQPLSLLVLPLFGLLYFPFKCVGNAIGRWALILTGVLLYVIIYMSPVFQAYYPLPFLVYALLGIVGLLVMTERLTGQVSVPFKYMVLFAAVLFYAGISRANLDETKLSVLTGDKPPLLTQKMYDIISKEKDPTLLNLGFGLANNLFTTCGIVPDVKYFMSPNLTYESWPDLRDEQTEYIKRRATQFVITQEWMTITRAEKPKKPEEREEPVKIRKTNNCEYFESLPAFRKNYSLILADTIVNTIDNKSLDIYKLYKRKEWRKD